MSVLVTYASSRGSTREIAERIAARLEPHVVPATVECKPIDAVPALSTLDTQYSAVVIGSAIHAGRWIGPGRRFLRKNAAVLSGKANTHKPTPAVWSFSVGMPKTDEDLVKEEQMMEKMLTQHLGEAVRGHKLFRGVFDLQDLNGFLRFVLGCCLSADEMKRNDRRDWVAIEGWADGVGMAMREAGIGSRTAEQA